MLDSFVMWLMRPLAEVAGVFLLLAVVILLFIVYAVVEHLWVSFKRRFM